MKLLDQFINRIREKTFWGLMVIFAVGILIYANILHAPFQFDDHELMINNPVVRNIDHLLDHWSEHKRKFITLLSFAINYHFGKTDTFGYHLVNVLLHIAAAYLLYFSILLLLRTPALLSAWTAQDKRLFAFFTSLFFLVHPLQTQSVTYIWERSEVLSGFFYLLSYLLYLSGRLKKNYGLLGAALVIFYIGFFAKETIVSLPLLIILTELIFFKHPRQTKILMIGGVCLSFVLIFVVWYSEKLMDVLAKLGLNLMMSRPSPGVNAVYLFTQFRVVLKYISLCFLPINQNLDYHFPHSQAFLEPNTFAAFLILLTILTAAIWLRKKNPLMTFGIFWFFIYLIPTSSGIVLLDPIYEHRVYLSVAGFAIFIMAFLFQTIPRPRPRNIIIIGLLVILSGLTVMRNNLWRSPTALLEDTVKKSPLNPRPYQILGTIYLFEKNDHQKAAELFRKVIEFGPNTLLAQAHNNLGLIYFYARDFEKAEVEFRKAVAAGTWLKKEIPEPYINLSYLALKQGDYRAAEELLWESLKKEPTDKAYVSLGALKFELQAMDQAKVLFQKALYFNPDNMKAHFGLGNVYAAEGQTEKALVLYQKAISLDPNFLNAYIELGEMYGRLNDWGSARRAFEQALVINPRRADVYRKLGGVYRALNDYVTAEEYYKKSDELFSQRLTGSVDK